MKKKNTIHCRIDQTTTYSGIKCFSFLSICFFFLSADLDSYWLEVGAVLPGDIPFGAWLLTREEGCRDCV